jgi:inhibitor of KinA
MESVVPLGDQAALAYFASEEAAFAFAHATRQANDRWLVDVVPAYASVAVFFDLTQITFPEVAERLRDLDGPGTIQGKRLFKHHLIPCCYEFQLDIERVAQHSQLTTDEITRLHAGTDFTVYAIGFCPGFPYLGYLPEAIGRVPRLVSPRLRVEAGSVGLTGKQTGIYTEARPGGWNIIGRTPLELVSVADDYFPLRAGDHVQFKRVDEREFRELQGNRL